MSSYDYAAMFCYAVVIAILYVLYIYYTRQLNYWKRRGVKGPTPLPLIGNSYDNIFTPLCALEEKRLLKYGRIYGTLEGGKPILTIAEPELLRQIGIKDFHNFVNRKNLFYSTDELLSKMLLMAEDKEWKRIRTIITPTFSSAKMKSMFALVDYCSDNAIQYFNGFVERNEEIDLKMAMMNYTIDVIGKCAFAIDTNSYNDPESVFIKNSHEVITVKVWRIICGIVLPVRIQRSFDLKIQPHRLFAYYTNTLRKVIEERRNIDVKQNDFVKLLMNAEWNESIDEEMGKIVNESEVLNSKTSFKKSNVTKRKLDDIEIISNCFLFLVAGYETTSSFLKYFFYVLATHSDVQKRLYEEIKSKIEKNKVIDYDVLNELPFLDAVVNETLRMYPPIINFDRVCANDYTLGDTGITIEKGTYVNLPFYALHHDPELFPEPHSFNPERFMPQNRDYLVPNSFIPFGIGPRYCVGTRFALMTAKLLIVKLMNRFEIVKNEKTVPKPVFNSTFLFLSCEPLIVSMRKRE